MLFSLEYNRSFKVVILLLVLMSTYSQVDHDIYILSYRMTTFAGSTPASWPSLDNFFFSYVPTLLDNSEHGIFLACLFSFG